MTRKTDCLQEVHRLLNLKRLNEDDKYRLFRLEVKELRGTQMNLREVNRSSGILDFEVFMNLRMT